MMRNILLPDRIGAHRLFATRILSICVQDDAVRGCVVLLKSTTATVEKLLTIPLASAPREDAVLSPQEAVAQLVSQAGKVDEVRLVISAALTIVKELDVPFIDTDKIRLTIDYEMEPLLPFGLDEALIDFFVTKSNKDLQSSQVLAMAMRKQDLLHILTPFDQADVKVKSVVVDLFTTYGLYKKIPAYQEVTGSSALVDVGLQGTRVIFLQANQLKLTRFIPKGLNSILSHICQDASVSREEALARIQAITDFHALDMHNPLEKSIQQHFIDFFNEIQFTLNSFSLKLNYYDGVSQILFSGKMATIPHFTKISTELLQIPCALFEPQKIFECKGIKSIVPTQNSIEWSEFISLLGSTLGPIEFEDFNLRCKELALLDLELGYKQLVTGLCIFTFMVCGISFISYSQIAELKATVVSLEQGQIEKLKMLLPRSERNRAMSLQTLTRKVEDIVKEKNTLWAPFGQERVKPLEMLLEVTQTFDKNQFKIDVEELLLNEKETGNPVIELDGYFKSDLGLGYNHKEWQQLEDRVQESPLLSFVEPPATISAAEKGIKFNVKLQRKNTARDANQPAGKP